MAQQNATVNWAGLPLVIKEMIMQKLADKQHGRDSPEDRKNRAAYAAVSSEWQHFFEARSFGKLVLHPSALEDFQRIIQRRQNLDPVRKADRMKLKRRPKRPAGEYTPPVVSRMPRIEHIWLRVELGLYDCRTCREPENTLVRARYVFPLSSYPQHAGWPVADSDLLETTVYSRPPSGNFSTSSPPGRTPTEAMAKT